jgi:deoxyribodipyrimidine photo-lyase
MKKSDKKCIHIFRRDYRIKDNTSLISASKKYKEIIPIFIFTYKQIRDNSLKSNACVKFLVESLEDLNKQLKNKAGGSRLRIYYGDEFQIIENLIKANPDVGAISFNQDYTKYSKSRDNKITKIAYKHNIEVISEDDYCLHPLGTITTGSGKPYTKFTPFYRKCLATTVRKVDTSQVQFISGTSTISGHNEYTAPLESMYDADILKDVKLPEKGGRSEGLKILSRMSRGTWSDYDKQRDLLIYKTTHLSPYNKFGCLSIREIFHIAKKGIGINSGIIRQLIWRDFYYNLGDSNPQIFTGAMSAKFNKISWPTDTTKFNAWTRGRTGYPIVDACIAEIRATGYMHNRGRLIVSNFLTRILHQDWRKGEHWFAKMLYDYDPIQNNFGWEVNAAVSGTESRPLTQTILNPWIQSKKYDPEAEYIKQWIPGLKDVRPEHLHRWDLHHDKYDLRGLGDKGYLKPIVVYEDEKNKNIELYRKYI